MVPWENEYVLTYHLRCSFNSVKSCSLVILPASILKTQLFESIIILSERERGYLSLRKEEPLPELSPQTPVSGYSWPRRNQVADNAQSLHLVLGLLCRLVHSRGVHSVTIFVHLLSLNRAMCPAHPCIPFLITSMISFTPF